MVLKRHVPQLCSTLDVLKSLCSEAGRCLFCEVAGIIRGEKDEGRGTVGSHVVKCEQRVLYPKAPSDRKKKNPGRGECE